VESFSQTKFSLDPSKLFKKNSSEDDCSKCEVIIHEILKKDPHQTPYGILNNKCKRFSRGINLDYITSRWESYKTVSDERFSEIERIEQEILECSNFYKKCECKANTIGGPKDAEDSFATQKKLVLENEPSIKDGIAQLRKQETQKLEQKRVQEESEKRALAMQDSSVNEIRTLIKEGTEANLILGKCDEHKKTFRQWYYIPECKSIQDSISRQQDITEITALLKANKLEKCLDKCKETDFASDEKITDLCKNQLAGKIKKLPKKSITSVALAEIYFTDSEKVVGFVIQNDGKMLLVEEIAFKTIMMIQHTGHIGECMLRPSRQIPFGGNVKYLGEKTYTTVLGVRQSVPNYQLLWCD
jgi:hypothetical protein